MKTKTLLIIPLIIFFGFLFNSWQTVQGAEEPTVYDSEGNQIEPRPIILEGDPLINDIQTPGNDNTSPNNNTSDSTTTVSNNNFPSNDNTIDGTNTVDVTTSGDIPYITIPSRYSGSSGGTQDCGEEGLAGQSFLFFKGPLVPCGVHKQCAGNNGGSVNKPCTLCHFLVLVQNFFNLLLSLLIIVSIFMLTVAGVLYIVSSGGKMATMAKEIIQKTILGFGLFLLSWLIVFTLLKLLAVNTSMLGTGSGWFQFTCDDESAFWVEPDNTGGGIGGNNIGGGDGGNNVSRGSGANNLGGGN